MTHSAPRNLLCIYPWLALGGADKFNLDMLTQLRARGWRIDVATTLPHSHPWRPQFEAVSDSIHDLGALPPQERPAALRALVAERRPGWVLVSNSDLGYRALPALRAAHPGAAYADYLHAVDPDDPRGGYPAVSLDMAGSLDLQITSSQTLRGWLVERGGDPARIQVCTTNIDTDDWDPRRFDRAGLRAALGIPPGAFVGLFAARIEHVKRPALVARLIRAAARAVPDAYFLVAGDGTYAGFMRGFLRAHRLEDRARMLGAVSNQRIRELLALSDVLLLPSRMEGLSLAIYEAMAMQVVPLSVAAGGQAELVTPECGVLVARGPGEERQYREALLRLARNRPQLSAMGRAARSRVQAQFGLSQMGDRMHGLLLEAAALHASAPRQPAGQAAEAALEHAVAGAIRDTTWFQAAAAPATTPRRRLRALYWQLVEHGAWWLVPLIDRLRRRDT